VRRGSASESHIPGEKQRLGGALEANDPDLWW